MTRSAGEPAEGVQEWVEDGELTFYDYDTRLSAYALILDGGRLLVSWYNGAGGGTPCWALPGGGVDYDEHPADGMVREVYEETGYRVEPVRLLGVETRSEPGWGRQGRPFKGVYLFYVARIVGGALGTTEVGGTTDLARWLPLELLESVERSTLLDAGLRLLLDAGAGA